MKNSERPRLGLSFDSAISLFPFTNCIMCVQPALVRHTLFVSNTLCIRIDSVFSNFEGLQSQFAHDVLFSSNSF